VIGIGFERSLKRYQKFTTLTTHTLNKLSVIATQNQNSAERFIKLGANKDKQIVHV
jgi:3-deoxy-D-manno-octulosonic-acid transferase